jgi:DNA-directed RNA polymerase subunit E'/Rpb7
MTIIERKICIEPEFLYTGLNEKLLDKVKKVYENECTKETGYILRVNKIVEIKDNYISNVNSSIVFVLDIDVDVLKPEINAVYIDKVSMIFSGGLFINIKNKIKLLIPISSLSEYKFDSSTKTFTDSKDKILIKENDEIKIKITGIKYSKKNFNCFGELI